jgi:hypothetical protein
VCWLRGYHVPQSVSAWGAQCSLCEKPLRSMSR